MTFQSHCIGLKIRKKDFLFLFPGFQYATILMKIALAAMVRRYKFSTNLKLSDLKLTFEVTLKLLNKYMVQIEKRG